MEHDEKLIPVRRALVSVSDKTGLVELAKLLHSFKVEIVSTGGTLKTLQEAGIPARSISDLTGFPEILDGRVKTLHPKVHGGLLHLRENKEHVATAKKEGIEPIDMVIVNLYPFEKVTSKAGVPLEEAIENIDIGGPSMLRSGSKNHQSVVVVCDPADYEAVAAEMKQHKGAVSQGLSFRLAVKVFEKTSAYDKTIACFLNNQLPDPATRTALPERISVSLTKKESLRYGENPHQQAALYSERYGPRVKFEQLGGKELSFNNMLDLDAALEILEEFQGPAACVIKHNNPCGVAQGKELADALDRAIDSDPLSAFGGIVGLNRVCDARTVEVLFKKLNFIEVIIAPDFEARAASELEKKKNLRILRVNPTSSKEAGLQYKFTQVGVLVQEKDRPIDLTAAQAQKSWKVVTEKTLKPGDWAELLFAWKCAKLVKSNAIVLTKDLATVGIGAGQMSRVDSVRIAAEKAGKRSQGAYLGSDAFFPMPDNIELAHKYGIKAIVQPGGSIKDEEVIAACNKHQIAMVFTGERHFRH